MRRRRRKNTLLPKMIGLAVLINAILLPVLAQFGVFKNIGGRQRLTEVELVKAPPPEKRPAPPKKAPRKQTARQKPSGHKSPAHAVAARRVPPGPPPVKVVAAAGPAGANGDGGDAGITTSDSGAVPPVPVPPIPPSTPPPVTPSAMPPTGPAPSAAPPSAPPQPVALPHAPVITAATPLEQPQPTIPDDLRDSELNAVFEGLFTVHADGTASVKMVSSTGNTILDTVALNTAHRWTFRPATRDGEPVESYLRLKIEFNVSS